MGVLKFDGTNDRVKRKHKARRHHLALDGFAPAIVQRDGD
jgi:hypothetical protein